MGILWFILTPEALFRVACKSFKACLLQDFSRSMVRIWGK
ncbi:Hypothetical protein HPV225_0031 [Helicobacter pylori v225d]|nr:Hypothetical protein HPV225_0031 [Helicobacter pylori v225d]